MLVGEEAPLAEVTAAIGEVPAVIDRAPADIAPAVAPPHHGRGDAFLLILPEVLQDANASSASKALRHPLLVGATTTRAEVDRLLLVGAREA